MGIFPHSPRPDDDAPQGGRGPQFRLFPLLPPELRLRIWKLNLPSSRLVPIRCGAASPSLHESPLCSRRTAGCTSDAALPANLHVCAESRAEALRGYGRAFGFARAPGLVIFNPHTDVVFFGPRDGYMAADSQFHTCMAMCDQAELARVRRVAISDALFWIDGCYLSMTAASLTVEVVKQLALRMPALDRIFFVPRPEDEAADLAVVAERMARQVQMAMATARQQLPHWTPPPWDIVPLVSLYSMDG